MSGKAAAGTCKSYIVAASMAAVEALKDQGFARWNYPLRTLHQRFQNKIKSSAQSSFFSSSSRSSASAASAQMRKANFKKTDTSIKKLMELDSFGPSTLRF